MKPDICHWCGHSIDNAGIWELHTAYVGPFEGIQVRVCRSCAEYISDHMAKRAMRMKDTGVWPKEGKA